MEQHIIDKIKNLLKMKDKDNVFIILESYTRDVKRPVCRMDDETAHELGLKPFDYFKLNNINKDTRQAEKVLLSRELEIKLHDIGADDWHKVHKLLYPRIMEILPLYPSDEGKGIIRIDQKQRILTKTEHGMIIKIKKSEVEEDDTNTPTTADYIKEIKELSK